METRNNNQPEEWQENEFDGQHAPVTESNQSYKYHADEDREDDDLEYDEDADDRDEDNEEDDTAGDWGTVDPLEHPGPPSDMDPAAPGSAV